jgi:hypothetical protein
LGERIVNLDIRFNRKKAENSKKEKELFERLRGP